MSIQKKACEAADRADLARLRAENDAERERRLVLLQKAQRIHREILQDRRWIREPRYLTHKVTRRGYRASWVETYDAIQFVRDDLTFRVVHFPSEWSLRHSRTPERWTLYVERWVPTKWHAIWGKKQVWHRIDNLADLGELLRVEGECK